MAKLDFFVGRDTEIQEIKNFIDDSNGVNVVLIDGVGGIGKTFLLQKISKQIEGEKKYVVDYFDQAEQPPDIFWQARHLATSVGKKSFPNFFSTLDGYAYGEFNPLEKRNLDSDIVSVLANELGKVLKTKQKMVRFLDTMETIPDKFFSRYELVKHFKDSGLDICFVSAGRETKDHLNYYEELLGKEKVLYREIKEFSPDEAKDFFSELDPEFETIPEDLREKLYYLTAGRPILLTLSYEWLKQHVPLPELITLSLAELQEKDANELQERFEFQLVTSLRRLKTPLDFAILYMSHIHRRVDKEVIKVLLDLDDDTEAKELFDKIYDMAFVKGIIGTEAERCALHDEMKVLVDKYAWPSIDMSGKTQKKITKKIIAEYYDPKIESFTQDVRKQYEEDLTHSPRTISSDLEWKLWRLETEKLYYYLQHYQKAGEKYFDEVYTRARENDDTLRMQFLLTEFSKSDINPIKAKLREAELLIRLGQDKEAKKICVDILKNPDVEPRDETSALITLGEVESRKYPRRAIDYNFQALKVAEKIGDDNIFAIIHNNLGQIYPSLSELDSAIEHYYKAIEYSKKAGNKVRMASASNNLAHVFRLKGDFMSARRKCNAALGARKDMRLEKGLAYSYLTRGEIDRDDGILEEAVKYSNKALELFSKVGAADGKAKTYRSLTNINRHMGKFEDAEEFLKRAFESAEKLGDLQLLSSLYHVQGRLNRHRALAILENVGLSQEDQRNRSKKLFTEALEALNKSLDIARDYGDPWLISRTWLEQVLIFIYLDQRKYYEKIHSLLAKVWESGKEINDVLIMGYVHENHGLINFRDKQFASTGKEFGEAAKCIFQRQGREPKNFHDRVVTRINESGLSLQEKEIFVTNLKETLIKEREWEKSKYLASLVKYCDEVLEYQSF